MHQINQRLNKALAHRTDLDMLRSLKAPKKGIDFYSNDYLGLTHNNEFHTLLLEAINTDPSLLVGATGSRLISGNSACTMQTEAFIAAKHKAAAALLFPSGFMANLALFSSVPKRGDTLLMDEFIHRSVRDGARLSAAQGYRFRHNDLNHLEQLLKKSKGTTFIAIESLYSMEGDFADLETIVALAERYQSALIVDEAHAFGVFGYGLVAHKDLQERVFATVITYGKAMGLHGSAILGSHSLISYLVNFAAAFIYTTALNDFHAVSLRKGYEFLAHYPELAQTLQQRILEFRTSGIPLLSAANSPIQTLLVPSSTAARALQMELEKQQLLTFAVVSPTVKAGTERLRICLHAFNTQAELDQLTYALRNYLTT
ncbi:aminotransferase class I/II-fold pyridoxal phosphate-dependent enzyme [Dyadobacter sp. LHD-138]|uniref:aminotransferase class I/II-fold pyridoxal phosphate-dependent enzyme n=1 Tax=Dyadobacter sp. LHD-138 TaxID=3071413 RepID=UPI0027E10D37|nr:aminotransferase class I/II-fold pyridoxal phosphate-dependent enzyme [Dyadobacter sp. LHD-138]MDQ6479451.1 aminotransferase class I/II-fold pyridoxal phosphate-dependent enzyme [Dyadobacter sp. LHD-138]